MKWLGIPLIILGVCIFFLPSGIDLYEHGMEYGWSSVLKIFIPLFQLLFCILLGSIVLITGIFLWSKKIREGWIDIFKSLRKKKKTAD